MQAPILNASGEQIDQIELRDDIFGLKPNKAVMHQALLRQLANARLGTHDVKTRGEVSGGGRKPFKQKGTGRARQGSTRAPHWRGGGRAFGPVPRSHAQRMPKAMRHLAVKSALSAKAAENQIRILDSFQVGDAPRTREMKNLLTGSTVDGTALIVLAGTDMTAAKSAANLKGVKTLLPAYLNVRDLLGYDYLVLSRESVSAIQDMFPAKPSRSAAAAAPAGPADMTAPADPAPAGA